MNRRALAAVAALSIAVSLTHAAPSSAAPVSAATADAMAKFAAYSSYYQTANKVSLPGISRAVLTMADSGIVGTTATVTIDQAADSNTACVSVAPPATGTQATWILYVKKDATGMKGALLSPGVTTCAAAATAAVALNPLMQDHFGIAALASSVPAETMTDWGKAAYNSFIVNGGDTIYVTARAEALAASMSTLKSSLRSLGNFIAASMALGVLPSQTATRVAGPRNYSTAVGTATLKAGYTATWNARKRTFCVDGAEGESGPWHYGTLTKKGPIKGLCR